MIAVVTGAASGIGRATAELLLSQDHDVYGVDIDENALATLPPSVVALPLDVSQATAWAAAADRIRERSGRVDWLVNAAALLRIEDMFESAESDWLRMFSVNLLGPLHAIRALVPLMAGGGAIVNVASVAAAGARPTQPHYAASKAALASLTRSAAVALIRQGIRVNAVSPGMVDTPIWERVTNLAGAKSLDEFKRDRGFAVPIGRLARPQELAAVIVFLLSEGASYVVGQTINVCGGLTITDAMTVIPPAP
jgi:galactitol 2-dehydrogenase